MRLLLDEMISPAVAVRLNKRGFDVQAVKGAPMIEGATDEDVLRWAATDRRALATFDADFYELHPRSRQLALEHYGVVILDKDRVPRRRAGVAVMIAILGELLRRHPDDDAFVNRLYVAP